MWLGRKLRRTERILGFVAGFVCMFVCCCFIVLFLLGGGGKLRAGCVSPVLL